MKNLVLLFVLMVNTCFSQKKQCDDVYLYDLLFENLKEKTSDTIAVDLDYSPSKLVLSDLKSSDFLTSKEVRIINLMLEKNYTKCDTLKKISE